MKRGSTVFLKLVLVLIAGLALTGLLVFPHFEGRNSNASWFQIYFHDPFLAYVYLTFVPFFGAFYQAFKLLGYIEKNKAFSSMSVKALQNITYCALVFVAFFISIMPFIYMFAEDDDSPGVILIALVIIFASIVVATAAGVFKRLLQNAVDIKSENDLTV